MNLLNNLVSTLLYPVISDMVEPAVKHWHAISDEQERALTVYFYDSNCKPSYNASLVGGPSQREVERDIHMTIYKYR